jgi:hypothetical protein
MAIKHERIEPHWNYLLALDADLTALSRYVDFHQQNFGCFSIEIARVLLASASEVDVVCKQLCRKITPDSGADGIHAYREEIKPMYPSIPNFKVVLPRFGLTLRPWEEWKKKTGVPLWWTAYNKVKHQRDAHFEKASLQNALNSVAGLFVMVLYLYQGQARLGELVPSPQLLRVDAEHYGGMHGGSYEIGIAYNL